jgi:hypothetical protein
VIIRLSMILQHHLVMIFFFVSLILYFWFPGASLWGSNPRFLFSNFAEIWSHIIRKLVN